MKPSFSNSPRGTESRRRFQNEHPSRLRSPLRSGDVQGVALSEIRQLPAPTERVETGAIQFENDWPGLFIRGDNAFALLMAIRFLFHFLDRIEMDPDERLQLSYLKTIAKIIDEDVICK